MLNNFRALTFSVLLLFIVFSCSSSRKNISSISNLQKTTFKNPISKGADPWVIKDGSYYFICSVAGKGRIAVSASKRLTVPGEKKIVWTPPDTGWNNQHIWAPELHKIDKKWYIYYAAGHEGPKYIYQRSGVLESVTDDPQGEYIDKGVLNTGVDKNDMAGTIWAIDFTITKINGSLYGIWSGWDNNSLESKTEQHLFIAKMSNPWTISSERVKISAPVEKWETGGPLNLNEGPTVLKHNKNTFIIYSTRESWLPSYCLGQLRLLDSAKTPMDPKNWKKSGPVFSGNQHAIGPGHASFTTSPDGKEWWIFYHSKKSTDPGWDRDIRLQKFTWKANGNPDFGSPLPTDSMTRVPSGEEKLN